MKYYGPAWVEVDLETIRNNINACQLFLRGKTKILAVVKADGYGHGAVEVAKVLEEELVDYLGVATIFEALELRQNGINMPILIFGYTPNDFVKDAIKADITLTIYNYEMAKHIAEEGQELGIVPVVHMKVDTGMTRLGFKDDDESVLEIKHITKLKLDVEGLYTHFAKADSSDLTDTHIQAKRYLEFIDKLDSEQITFAIKHICNSAGTMVLPEYHLDMVRVGGILYGHFCLGHYLENPPFEVSRAISIKAVLANIIEVAPDTGVSYGWLYKTNRRSRIATIPIGYTDGISRNNSNQTSFLLNGERVNQVGLICMDQMMIDVSDVDCHIGDVVTLLGVDREEITLNERAGDAGIGKCELFAGIGRRLPKVYFVKDTYKKNVNYLLQY